MISNPGQQQQQGTAQQGHPQTFRNSISPLGELKITLTADSNGAGTNVLIMPGPVPSLLGTKGSTTIPDGTHVTLTSSVSTTAAKIAEFNAYIAQVGMVFSYLRITTTDTDNFLGSLFICEVPPNGIISPEEIVLTTYRTGTGGGGYDTTMVINDRPFANSKNFALWISNLKVSTSMTFNFGIAAFGQSISATPTS